MFNATCSNAEQEEETDESTERREVVKMADPREPTEEERREQNLTHLPFRSWCPQEGIILGKPVAQMRVIRG